MDTIIDEVVEPIEADVSDGEPCNEITEDADVNPQNGDSKVDEHEEEDEKRNSHDEKSSRRRERNQRRKREIRPEHIPEIMANNVQKQRNEVWKKTVMMGPVYWDDMEDPDVTKMLTDACTCALIYRKKANNMSDCHLELRHVNHGDAASCGDRLERPMKTRTGHTIRRRTRMPVESQMQEWDQMMFSRMYMGNRVFLYVDNIPPTASKEDIFATFPSCSYITFTLKPDMLTGYSVIEYRNEEDVDDDIGGETIYIHGNELTTFLLSRSSQFHDRGRPVAAYHRVDEPRFSSSQNYSNNNPATDMRALGGLESMLLQEIGRKVMVQSQLGSLMGQSRSSSKNQSYNSGRW